MKKIIFSTLLAASMSVGAICNNTTVKGLYDIKIKNADSSIIEGTISFNGLSNINFYGSLYQYGEYTTTLWKFGTKFTGKGAYLLDNTCKLTGIGNYVYNGYTTQSIMSTTPMTIVNGHATYGTGKFNAATMTLRTR